MSRLTPAVMKLAVLGLAAAAPGMGAGSVSFDSIFHGGAVLQRRTAVSVRGRASGGHVHLALNGVPVPNCSAAVINDRWHALLPPQEASWNQQLSVHSGSDTATVTVSFGGIYLLLDVSVLSV